MQNLLRLLSSFAIATTALAQGQFNFNNYVRAATPPVFAPITLFGTGVGLGAYPNWKAQLFLVAGSTKTAIGDVTSFRTSPPAAQAFINGITVVVPGIDVGGAATVVVRVWNDTSLGTSGFAGESRPITITLGGGTSVPADLTGLESFQAWPRPEPSTLALSALGLAVLFLRRGARPPS